MKLSIILPIYNCEKYVEECINSILQQSFEDFELIIVNDGSTDGSFEKCSQFRAEQRVRIINKENQGVSIARNIGFSYATSPYIMFVDSDDILENDMLEMMYNKIINDKTDLCVCGIKNFYENSIKDETWGYRSGIYSKKEYVDILLKFFTNPFIGGPFAKIFSRRILAKGIAFEEHESFAEDFVFNMKYLRFVNNISILEHPYYLRRADNPDSLSKSKRLQIPLWERKKYVFTEWNKTLAKLSENSLQDTVLIQKFAVKTLIDVCVSEKEKRFVKSFVRDVLTETNLIIGNQFIKSYKLIFYANRFNSSFCILILKLLSNPKFQASEFLKKINR